MYMLENGKIDVVAYMQHVRDTKARIHGKPKTQPVVMLPKKPEEIKDEEKAKPFEDVEVLPELSPGKITSLDILKVVAHVTGISIPEIRSSRRQKELVRARFLACILIKELTTLSYPAAGRAMGGRDHTSILNAVITGTKRMKEDQTFMADYLRIKDILVEQKDEVEMELVNEVLEQRKKVHGSYDDYANINGSIMKIVRNTENYDKLDNKERSSLDMILSKVSRILSGDPHFQDHWVDIAGYATLVVKEKD